jgi:hypothetical protein
VTAVVITPDDLSPFASIDAAKAAAMIDDAMAMAARVAPCINSADFAYPDAARAVIRGAILRWHEAGNGSSTQLVAGPFQQATSTPRKGMFWPSEISDLTAMCASSTGSRVFELDTMPADAGVFESPNLWWPVYP